MDLRNPHPVLLTAAMPEVITAMEEFYREVDQRIAAHHPQCINRGACCRFGSYDHRLYVTPLELAYFCARHHRHDPSPENSANAGDRGLAVISASGANGDHCPYQQHGLCTAREGRPLGCRVFFCESAGEGWQEQLSESALQALKKLHNRFKLPYRYTEWLNALSELHDRHADSSMSVAAGG